MENAYLDPPRFRYKEEMEQFSVPCPPEDCMPRETVAFRWVFERLEDGHSFIPGYIKYPKRFGLKEAAIKCQALGLSFFDDEKSARAQFEKLKRRMQERVWHLGKNLARGIIQKDFGVACAPDEKGHFTFHPFERIVLDDHFQIIAPL